MSKKVFITGIGTGVGKTLVSAIFTEALGCDYWKPVQCGHPRDTDFIRQNISNTNTRIFPERFVLKEPASPHMAAAKENVSISLHDFEMPVTSNHLIIEGAGGLMVPLNHEHLITDLIKKLDIPVILVASYYLGSINHTLMSLEVLRAKKIPVRAVVFCGQKNKSSYDLIIRHLHGVPAFELSLIEHVGKESIKKIAETRRKEIAEIVLGK